MASMPAVDGRGVVSPRNYSSVVRVIDAGRVAGGPGSLSVINALSTAGAAGKGIDQGQVRCSSLKAPESSRRFRAWPGQAALAGLLVVRVVGQVGRPGARSIRR